MEEGKDRFDRILEALEHERQEEENYFKVLSQNKTVKEKVSSGVAWYPCQVVSNRYSLGELLEIELERFKEINKPHKLKVGTRATLFQVSPDAKDHSGTISYIKRNRMGIILHNDELLKDNMTLKGNFGVEIIYDERPYQVMRSAINHASRSKEEHIRDIRNIINLKTNTRQLHHDLAAYQNQKLNKSQNNAVNAVLNTDRVCIIHGPPGTGKTTTLVAAVKALSKSEKRILVCSSSNNAVDLLARQLDAAGLKVLRIGNVTRIGESIAHLTLAEQSRMHTDWQHIKKVKIEAQEAKRQAKTRKRKFGTNERSYRNAMYQESRALIKWAKDLEHKLTAEIIHNAQAVCSTLIGLSNRQLDGLMFDTVVIDEASQALEPECWNAILKAKRVILAGDHLQLSPTVKSQKAIALGLAETILDRLNGRIHNSHLLDTQYRMNDKILGFSNQAFYNDQLKSDPSVKEHLLEQDTEPLVFIDTSGCGFQEARDEKTMSYFNEGEFFIIREHILQKQDVYQNVSIGIIAPYSQQVRYLRDQVSKDEILKKLPIEIDSIDGFQGQEKDLIIISLVRSNMDGEIGFLKDERRLNVALTRARKKLIVLGDGSTLSQHKLYDQFMNHVENHGTYQSAWEYMAT